MNENPSQATAPERVVLTLLGPDRAGIVARVAAVVADHGGNWMESRMVHLGGQFAGIVQAQVPANQRDALLAEIDALRTQGLQFTLETTTSAPTEAPARNLHMELVTPDRPGVLKEVSAIFARHAFNIEELATEFVAAPWSGELLFKAVVKLSAGETSDLDSLREALEATSTGMMLDVSLQVS